MRFESRSLPNDTVVEDGTNPAGMPDPERGARSLPIYLRTLASALLVMK